MSVTYEWDCEIVDLNKNGTEGDIYDHNHGDSLAEVMRTRDDCDYSEETQKRTGRIVLVRDQRDACGELGERSWCYVEPDGTLPERFADSMGEDRAKVPQRFRKEFERDFFPPLDPVFAEALKYQGLMGHLFTILEFAKTGWRSKGEAGNMEAAHKIAAMSDLPCRIYRKQGRGWRVVSVLSARLSNATQLDRGTDRLTNQGGTKS